MRVLQRAERTTVCSFVAQILFSHRKLRFTVKNILRRNIRDRSTPEMCSRPCLLATSRVICVLPDICSMRMRMAVRLRRILCALHLQCILLIKLKIARSDVAFNVHHILCACSCNIEITQNTHDSNQVKTAM